MSPKLRTIIYLVVGAAIGVSIGIDVADESYAVAVLIGASTLWLVVNRVSPSTPDVWLLGVTVAGYIIGNRGFAQLQPSDHLPLLPAEAALLVTVPALVLRTVMRKTPIIGRDGLNYAILIWMIVGTIRLPLDVQRYGVIAVRDYAMVYYASFFFVAQAFAPKAVNVRVLTGSITFAIVCLMPVVVSILISPEYLAEHVTWNGIPLIFHKSDLIANSLGAGFFWLRTRWEKDHRRIWIALASVCLLLIGEMASPRAAMFAVAVTTLLWVWFKRWRIAAVQVGIVSAAALLVLGYLSLTGGDLEKSAPYSMYEHAISIFDPSGSGTYINGKSGDPGDNNRFRIVWWKDVIEDTTAENPIFGLGFGTDLAARFVADYGLVTDESFAARSPHSMIVTTYGRMGLLGLSCWLVASAFMARTVYRVFKTGDPDAMGLCCIVTMTWLSACVGVVLESPMAAVFFWTALGLAHGRLHGLTERPAQAKETVTEDWPVAKPVPVDTY